MFFEKKHVMGKAIRLQRENKTFEAANALEQELAAPKGADAELAKLIGYEAQFREVLSKVISAERKHDEPACSTELTTAVQLFREKIEPQMERTKKAIRRLN